MAFNNDAKKLELFGGGTKDPSKFKEAPKQDAMGNRIPGPEEEITLIEKEMQDVRVMFEHFFLGMEKKAPLRRRDMLGERIRRFRMSQGKIPTMLRYRFDHAQSKFMSMERVWSRTLNEIESGTYKRDVFKMKLKQQQAAFKAPVALTPSQAARLVEWGNDEETQEPPTFAEPSAPPEEEPEREEITAPQPVRAAAPRSLPVPPVVSRAPVSSQPPGTLSPKQVQALHQAYVAARERTQESSDGITVESLTRTLSKQVPALLKKYDCTAIDFKVVIKDNKTVLKAVPRR